MQMACRDEPLVWLNVVTININDHSACSSPRTTRPGTWPTLAVPRSLCRARCAALAVPYTTAPSCNETHSQTMFHVMSFATPRPALAGALVALALAAAGCSGGGNSAADASSSTALINAVGAENEYANVLGQIGGRYVHVSSILDNPNTDPHTFEASASVAREVSGAQIIVQNGVGYDSFLNRIESATPNSARKVITVQHVLGLPDSTPNPHL